MSKKLALLIVATLSLGMMLVGCKSESPTDVVNEYFEQIKKGDNEQAAEFIESTMSQTKEETSAQAEEETDKVMEEALKIYLSKIDAKVLSEKIDGDNATVEVELNAPNFSNMMMEVIGESLSAAFSGEEMDEDYMSQSLLEKVKSSENEPRTGKISLTKGDKQWKIKSDDVMLGLILGEYNGEGGTESN